MIPSIIDEAVRVEDRLVAAFERIGRAPTNGSTTVERLRGEAIERFAELGLPTQKSEAWKYTNIQKAFRHAYTVEEEDKSIPLHLKSIDSDRIPGLDAHEVVIVNGRFSPELSRLGTLPKGVIIEGFGDAVRARPDLVSRHYGRYADFRQDALRALNTAFARDGLFVFVPQDTIFQRPLHVINVVSVGQELMMHPRHLYVVESQAALQLIETRGTHSSSRTLTNSVTEIFAGPSSRLEHYRVQNPGDSATEVNDLQVYQERDSVVTTATVTLSGALVRNNISFLPDAEGCESHLYGLFLVQGNSHVDSHTLVDHARPNCSSNELYKGILEDEATGVFNGKVHVRPDAQKTNAYQSNRSIVLSRRAQMYSKPELEIYADDVKCSHGATTGELNPEAMFYLRSRGLSERFARALLLQAFARDVIDKIRIEPLRKMLDQYIVDRYHD